MTRATFISGLLVSVLSLQATSALAISERSSAEAFADSVIQAIPEALPAAQLAKGVISQQQAIAIVKSQYRGQSVRVLRVVLNPQRTQYQVRVLLPNGKVRHHTVNAKR